MALTDNARPSSGWAEHVFDLFNQLNNFGRQGRRVEALSDRELQDIGATRIDVAQRLDRDLAALRGKGMGPLM